MVDKKDLFYGKIPPQAIEIEEAILGAILLEGSSFIKVSHYFVEEIFYKPSHSIIMKAIKAIHESKGNIDILTVTDKLRIMGELESVGGPVFISNLPAKVGSTNHLEFHCMVISDKFLLRELIRIGYEIVDKAFKEEDPSNIAEWGENEILQRFNLDIDERNNFKEALHSTMQDIINKAQGIVKNFIKTGDSEVDEKISFRERQICLIAGSEGCGKTKYITYLVKGMLDNNENLRILWFSMEDSKEQIVRSFISMDAKLTTKQLQSINHTLSENEIEKINKISKEFSDYKIEFVDRVCSIQTIVRKTRNYREKYKDSSIAVVVDNLGLISTESFYKGIEKDDYLAGKLKELCDTTNVCMFLLHHITKESAQKFNLKEGYRPRREYIRGSARIIDYVQQAILVNLPRKYKDLVMEEKGKAKTLNVKTRTGKFDKTRFLMEFWTINPKGDKNTKTISDLQEATWNELKFACATETDEKGEPIGAGYIIKKYVEYSFFIDEINKNRKEGFESEKLSIYSFITNKKFKEDYSPKKDTRTYYLYGNDITLSANINDLFIVETVKNRDGSDVEDESIIRYSANLDYNIFIPIIQKE